MGRGVESAGKSIEAVSDRWMQIQTDYQLNNALKEGDQVVEQYGNLRGDDALNQQQHTRDQLDEIRSRYISHLAPAQQHMFDQTWRAYQDRLWNGKISTHSIEQGYSFGTEQNKASEERAHTIAAQNYNNPVLVESARREAQLAVKKQLVLDGQAGDKDSVARALANSDAEIYKSAAEAMYAHDPVAARNYVEQHRDELGLHYAQLADKYQAKKDQLKAERNGQGIIDTVKQQGGAAPAPPSNNVLQFPTGKPAGQQGAAQERPPAWTFATRPNAHSDRNLFSSGAARRMGIEGGVGQNLVTIGTNPEDGTEVKVNARAAPHFAGFLKELESTGYKIRSLGGYNDRNIAGTHIKSEHAFGNAIDINPDENPRGGGTNLPPNVGAIAAKYGLIWGGDWTGGSRDPMHFEWSGKTGQRVAGTE